MTDPKHDPKKKPEDVTDETKRTDTDEAVVPELELEDISWELEDASEPEAEEAPAPPVDAAAFDEPTDEDAAPELEDLSAEVEEVPYDEPEAGADAAAPAALDPFVSEVAASADEDATYVTAGDDADIEEGDVEDVVALGEDDIAEPEAPSTEDDLMTVSPDEDAAYEDAEDATYEEEGEALSLEPDEAAEAYDAEPEPEPEPEQAAAPPPPPPLPDMEEPEEEAGYSTDWGWKVVRSGFTPFVFEAHDEKFYFASGSAQRIDDAAGIGRYFKYLVDYAESPGMGLLTLTTEYKYAGVLARKNLEEVGELNTEGTLHMFAKRKLEGGQVSVFYEVLPRDRHVAMLESYNASDSGFVFLDSISLAFGLLKKKGRGAHAIALHLPSAIVLVAGKGGDVHLARRYTLVGDDEQALVEGLFALDQDLAALEKNVGQKISHVDWVEALTATLELPRPDTEIPLVPMPVHELSLDGDVVWSALPTAVGTAPTSANLGPKQEMYLRPLEQAEKWLWAVFLALALVAGAGVYAIQGVRSQVKEQVQMYRQELRQVEERIRSRAVNVAFEDVDPALNLANSFRRSALSPPFGELWNFLASLRPEAVRVDGMELRYGLDAVDVRLEGQVEMELAAAQQVFTTYIEELELAGFTVVSQQLDLDLEGNYYSLNIRWPLSNKGD
ncbi:hypothetical protein JCM16814_04970 [Desulfobaculum senezii]